MRTQRPSVLPARRALERRWLIVACAAALCGLVFALRQAAPRIDDTLTLLYVIPVAFIALEFGLRGGAAAALLAVALLEVWMMTSRTDLDALGVATRATAFIVVGAVAGEFANRMRDGNARQRRLLDTGLALSHLSGDPDPAATLAVQTIRIVPADVVEVKLTGGGSARRGDGVAAWVQSVPIALRGERLATVTVGTHRPLNADDRAVLDIFALQAALAVQNRRLLERERERVLILAELRDAQERLIERGSQMQALVTRQEAERGEVARELHDDAAQVLAAVLLDLKGLERQVGHERAGERWQTLRANIDATLQSLRSLAVSLRPPILRLGLQTALEDLADAAREHGVERFQIDLDAAVDITPELETVVYRIVEEVLAAVGPAREVAVSTNAVPAVIVAVHRPQREIHGDRLTVLKARLDVAGGSLTADADALIASVPLAVPSQTPPPLPATGAFDM